MSTNVMFCTHVAVLPARSVAVHVLTIDVPAQFAAPAASRCENVTGPQSVAVGIPVAPGSVGELQRRLTSGGQVITGGVGSVTTTGRLQVTIAPLCVVCVTLTM